MQESFKVKVDRTVEAHKAKLDELAKLSIPQIIQKYQLDKSSDFYKEIDRVISDFEKLLPNNRPWFREGVWEARRAELKRLKEEGYNQVKRTVGDYEIYDDKPLLKMCSILKKDYERLTIVYSAYDDLPKNVIKALAFRAEGKLKSSDTEAIAVIDDKLKNQAQEELRKKIVNKEKELSVAQIEIEEHKQGAKLQQYKEKIATLKKENQILKMDKEGLQAQLNEIIEKGADAVLKEENKRLNTDVIKFREQLTEAVGKNSELANEVQTLKQNVVTLKKNNEDALEKISTLEEDRKQDKEESQQTISTLQRQVAWLMAREQQREQQQNRGGSEKDYRASQKDKSNSVNPHDHSPNNNKDNKTSHSNEDDGPHAPNHDEMIQKFNKMVAEHKATSRQKAAGQKTSFFQTNNSNNISSNYDGSHAPQC